MYRHTSLARTIDSEKNGNPSLEREADKWIVAPAMGNPQPNAIMGDEEEPRESNCAKPTGALRC